MVIRPALISACLVLAAAAPALADRHLGWCIGVGNPHQSAYCGGTIRPPVTNPVTANPGLQTPIPNPPSTQLPQVTQEPVPQTIVLPVLPQMPPMLQSIAGPGETTVTQGGGPVVLPPLIVTLPNEPRPLPTGTGTQPVATMPDIPALSYVSHQIAVGPLSVPQIVVNATGPGAQVVPGQIILTPVPVTLPRPPAGTTQPQMPPALVPQLPAIPNTPQGTPSAHVPGAILVPVLVPPRPQRPDPVPQGTPDPQRPGQVLVPVLLPDLPPLSGNRPQGVPGAQLPSQVLVPVLIPPRPVLPDPVPQGVPNPQRPTALQPPPTRPTVTLRPQAPQVIGVVVFPRPKPRPVDVPPTTVLQPTTTHSPVVTHPPVGTTQITDLPGRQPGGTQSGFADENGGANWNCVASGLGPRQVLKGGRIISTGVERHLGNVDALGRDVPAKHPKHPHCIISVQRRDGN